MIDEIKYLDFEITVHETGENQYQVTARSGKDKAEMAFINPFNEDKRALIGATLNTIALRSVARVRSSSAPEVKKMKEVGSTLFQHAINGPVREFYNKCQSQADAQGKGIRWRFTLDPSVSDLPWEFLCLQDRFLALHPRSPVVRYIQGAEPVATVKGEHPLRVLVVIAGPKDVAPLDTEAEKGRIGAALEPLIKEGLVDIEIIEGPDTWETLMKKVRPNQTHILHFIGHGEFDEKNGEGVLIMEDADSNAMRIESERLGVLVQGKSRLQLVILNSCLGTQGDSSRPFSSMAAGLVRSGVPAVIAMQFEISDQAARKISETFYSSLALNFPVDAALTEARRQIFLSDRESLEWATPILYMQVPDGQLFHFPIGKRERRATTQPPSEPETLDALAVLAWGDTGAEMPLSRKSIKIGRGSDNDIDLDQVNVSRKHAALVRSKDTYALENFGRSGTLLNGKPLTRRTRLKHNDVIKIGNAEFKFRLLADVIKDLKADTKAPAATERETFSGPEPPQEQSLESKAAERYAAGKESMARGSWAEAITAFRGALMFLPGYRDTAKKLADCEARYKVVSIYNQARSLCAAKNYDHALLALAEAKRLDPKLIDTDNIRESAECGQKYQRAIVELQRGNRDGGATLLREVLNCRPNFEDAERRLMDLAAGGSGLPQSTAATESLLDKGKQFWADMFGATSVTPPAARPGSLVPSPGPQPPPQKLAATGWREYALVDTDLKQLAEELRQYFYSNDYESQMVQQEARWIVQGRKVGLRSWVGMGQAATIVIEPSGENVKVSIGGGKWLEQGAVMAAGILLGPALWVTSAVGMHQQQKLLNTLWQLTEEFVTTNGGQRVG
jgi:tetratricopeptide (TPR) repeat protein